MLQDVIKKVNVIKSKTLNSRNYVMGSTHGNPVNHRDWVIILLKCIYKNCQTSELILWSRQVFLICCPPLWWQGALRSVLLCDLKTAFWQPAFIPTSFYATLCVIQNRIMETTFPKHLCLQGSGCDFISASVFMWDFVGGRRKWHDFLCGHTKQNVGHGRFKILLHSLRDLLSVLGGTSDQQ